MITEKQISELENMLSMLDLSVLVFPVKIRPGETIANLKGIETFIDSSLAQIAHNRNNKWFIPTYERLYEFLSKAIA